MSVPFFKAPWQIDVIGGLLSASFVMAAWLVVIGPRVDGMRQVAARHQAAEQRLLDAARQAGAAQRVAEKLESVEKQISSRPSTLRPGSDVNQQVALISQLATSCSLETDALRLGKCISGRDYDTIPIDYAGRGSFASIAALLGQLQERTPDVAVMSFVVSGQAKANEGELQVEMVLAWYTAPSSPAHVAGAR